MVSLALISREFLSKIKYMRGVIGEVSPGEIVTAGKLNSVAIATEDRLRAHFAFSLEYDLDQSAYRGKERTAANSLAAFASQILELFDGTLVKTSSGGWTKGHTSYNMSYTCRSNGKNKAKIGTRKQASDSESRKKRASREAVSCDMVNSCCSQVRVCHVVIR